MVFFGIVGVFAVWILVVFFRDVVRARTIAVCEDGTPRRLAAPRKFALGAGLLGVFAVVLVAMVAPLFGGQNLLAVADELFNERAKASTDVLAKANEKAADWTGTDVDLGVSPGELRRASGDDGGRLRARRDVAHAGRQDPRDRQPRHARSGGHRRRRSAVPNDVARLEEEYGGQAAPESVYAWWLVFDGLSRRYVQENRADEAAFTKLVATKVLEPAYNFRGIEVTSSGESTAKLVGAARLLRRLHHPLRPRDHVPVRGARDLRDAGLPEAGALRGDRAIEHHGEPDGTCVGLPVQPHSESAVATRCVATLPRSAPGHDPLAVDAVQ